MKFKPLRDRVFVRFSTEEEKTAGGLYIPDTAKEKPQRGTVIAVGPGKVTDDGKRQPVDVKVGDTVEREQVLARMERRPASSP